MSDTPKENVWARDLAWRLLRDAADGDYLIARWSMKANLPYQFAWSAQQCLEKYLKCSLVLNGEETRNYHHNLKEMWHKIAGIADDLLPIVLCPPWYFPNSFTPHGGRFELASTFVERVEKLGDPNQRYRYYSIVNEVGDIHKLDQIVFALRRITFPLEMAYGSTSKSYRQMLSENRALQPHPKFSFAREGRERGKDERARALKWQNFSFFEDEAIEQGTIQRGLSSINSPISMNLNKTKERSQALNWLMQHVKFSKQDRAALEQALGLGNERDK